MSTALAGQINYTTVLDAQWRNNIYVSSMFRLEIKIDLFP